MARYIRVAARTDACLVQAIKQTRVNPRAVNEFGVGYNYDFFRTVALNFPTLQTYGAIDPHESGFLKSALRRELPLVEQLRKVECVSQFYERTRPLPADVVLSNDAFRFIENKWSVIKKALEDLVEGGIAVFREQAGSFGLVHSFPSSAIGFLRGLGLEVGVFACTGFCEAHTDIVIRIKKPLSALQRDALASEALRMDKPPGAQSLLTL